MRITSTMPFTRRSKGLNRPVAQVFTLTMYRSFHSHGSVGSWVRFYSGSYNYIASANQWRTVTGLLLFRLGLSELKHFSCRQTYDEYEVDVSYPATSFHTKETTSLSRASLMPSTLSWKLVLP